MYAIHTSCLICPLPTEIYFTFLKLFVINYSSFQLLSLPQSESLISENDVLCLNMLYQCMQV